MSTLTFRNLVGQNRPREVLSAAFARGTLGHAYLLCGEEGVGTFQAALELALGVLCRSTGDVPCYTCDSCRKALHANHPDLSIVLPLCLSKEHRGSEGGLSDQGWDHVAETVRNRIAQPYLALEHEGLPTVPVDWVREVMRSVQRGSLEGASHVAIFCGVELLNKESANAMLRTLEEPPAGSLLLLCSEAPHNLLPTIRSRCQVVRFGRLGDGEIAAALRERLGEALDAETLALALAGAQGSLGAALRLAGQPDHEGMQRALRLWQLAAGDDGLATAACVDELASSLDAGACEKLLIYCVHIVRGGLLAAAADRRAGAPLAVAGLALGPDRAQRLTSACHDALHGVRARGNPGLVLADFALSLSEILHE